MAGWCTDGRCDLVVVKSNPASDAQLPSPTPRQGLDLALRRATCTPLQSILRLTENKTAPCGNRNIREPQTNHMLRSLDSSPAQLSGTRESKQKTPLPLLPYKRRSYVHEQGHKIANPHRCQVHSSRVLVSGTGGLYHSNFDNVQRRRAGLIMLDMTMLAPSVSPYLLAVVESCVFVC